MARTTRLIELTIFLIEYKQHRRKLFDMDEPMPKLKNPPIVEAVLNIECDIPPSVDLATLQDPMRKAYFPQYPKFKALFLKEHRFEVKLEAEPHVSVKQYGVQLIQEDEKQLIQIRSQGFSFNRLAPYTTLDDYMGEIERTWTIFINLVSPVQIRLIQLRYINRIQLPMPQSKLQLEDYFKICPRLPDEERLAFIGFLNQHTAIENETGNLVNIILTAQSAENGKLPIIFDITATCAVTINPKNWGEILVILRSLRGLKNRVFRDTLTEACINLFQQ